MSLPRSGSCAIVGRLPPAADAGDPDIMDTRRTLGIAALIILFGLLLRTPYLLHRMQDIDEGSHAAVAAILMDGGLPYRDAVNNKPPGVWYVYLATFLLFGKYNMFAVHAVAFFWTLGTALVLALLAKKLSGRAAALFALLFYLTFTAALYPKMIAANTEIFMALPYSAAVLLLWYAVERQRWHLLMLSGCCSGLAFLFKQVGGVEAAAVLVFILCIPALSEGRGRIAAALRASALYGTGFLLPAGAVAAVFCRLDILDDWVFWNVAYPGRYIRTGFSSLSFSSQILAEFVPFVLSTVILWVLAGVWTRRVFSGLRSRGRAFAPHFSLFLVLWLAASALVTFAGNRMYGHYFIQILPPLSLVAALLAGDWVREKQGARRRAWIAAILFLTLVPGAVFTGMALPYEAVTETWGELKPDFRPATDYIRAHTDPGDRIFVWGWFTPFYVYSERTPATRFVFTTMLTGYRPGDGPGEKDRADITWQLVPESWAMLEEDLRRHRPELIVDTSPGDYHYFGRYPVGDFPVLSAYIGANCRLETRIAGAAIYRCGGQPAPGTN